MVFKYCLGMIMSVSTLMIFKGAATPSSLVNLSIGALPMSAGASLEGQDRWCNANGADNKGTNPGRRYALREHDPEKGMPVFRKDHAQPKDLKRGALLAHLGLDFGHVVVREAKMVADLVDQHVADDVAQRLLMLGPIIQDRAAVEPDHVGHAGDIARALERQPDPLEQAEHVEFALALHLVQHLVGREIVDADDHAFAQVAKPFGQALEDVMGHRLHCGERGRFQVGPHGPTISALSATLHLAFVTGAGCDRWRMLELNAGTKSGERDEGYRGGTHGFSGGRACSALDSRLGAEHTLRRPRGAGGAGRRVRAAAGAPGATAARLSELRSRARSVPALLSRSERRARMQRHLCAGISAERHRHRAARELLLAARLAPPYETSREISCRLTSVAFIIAAKLFRPHSTRAGLSLYRAGRAIAAALPARHW